MCLSINLSIKRLLFSGFIHELQDKCFIPSSCHKSMVVFSVSIVTIVSIVETNYQMNSTEYIYDFKTSSRGYGFWDTPPTTPLDLQLIPKLKYRSMHAKKFKDNLDSGFHAMDSEF